MLSLTQRKIISVTPTHDNVQGFLSRFFVSLRKGTIFDIILKDIKFITRSRLIAFICLTTFIYQQMLINKQNRFHDGYLCAENSYEASCEFGKY